MGSYRGGGRKRKQRLQQGHGRNDPDYFGNPKFPKSRKHAHGAAGSDAKKSPLAIHFFFWVVVLTMFMTIFGVFQTQIQNVVLWNDVYTLFGAISYWDATIGWTITIIVAMCVDMILVA